MADKKLLEEATIRRFMKLANISSSESGMLSEGVGTPYDKKVTKSSKNSIKVNGRKPGKGLVRESEMEQEGLEEAEYEEGLEEMYHEEEGMVHEEEGEEDTGADMGGMDFGGDEGGGGGDVKASVEKFVKGLADLANELLTDVGSDESMEAEAGDGSEDMADMEGGEEEGPEAEDEMMSAHPVAEKKNRFPFKKKQGEEQEEEEEGLEESIELVDDSLIETLLQRVTARLVAEAKKKKADKNKEPVKEGKGAGGSKSHSPKGAYKPHGAGKGAPYTGSQKILGLKGKHQTKKSR